MPEESATQAHTCEGEPVLWAGCKQVLAPGPDADSPPTCLLRGSTSLKLWVCASRPPSAKLSGAALDLPWEPRPDGFGVTVELEPQTTGELRLEGPELGGVWRLALKPDPLTEALLEEHPELGPALLTRARKLSKEQRWHEALHVATRAAEVLDGDGRSFEALRARLLLGTVMSALGTPDPRLLTFAPAAPGHFESLDWVGAERAEHAERLGDLRAALGELQALVVLEERLGEDLSRTYAAINEIYLKAGLFEEAFRRRRETLCSLKWAEAPRLARLRALTDLVWTEIRAVEVGQSVATDLSCTPSGVPPPSDRVGLERWILEEARRYEEAHGDQPAVTLDQIQNIEVNLVIALVQDGRWTEARAAGEALLAEGNLQSEYLWLTKFAVIEATLEEGGGSSRAGTPEALAAALDDPDPEIRLRAARLAAIMRMRVKDWEGARQVASDALAWAGDRYALLPSLVAGGTYASIIDPLTRISVECTWRLGDAEGAFRRFREARISYLRARQIGRRLGALSPDEQRTFTGVLDGYARVQDQINELKGSVASVAERDALPEQERRLREEALALLDNPVLQDSGGEPTFSAPGPGQLWLGYYRVDAGWLGFAEDVSGVELRMLTTELPSESKDALARSLLDPFAQKIRAAKEIHLLPSGALRGEDLHTLPFEGEPLALGRPVSYKLDLPPVVSRLGGQVLVVANTQGDLDYAESEAQEISGRLPDARLLVRDNATRAAFFDAFQDAGLLFFASHADFESDLWSSRLVLAGDERVEIADLLVQHSAPRTVVLTACEGAAGAQGVGETLGIAQAFLLAGSEQVMAPTRVLPDELGLLFSRAYADQRAQGEDGAEAWLRAVQHVAERAPSKDWQALRRIVR